MAFSSCSMYYLVTALLGLLSECSCMQLTSYIELTDMVLILLAPKASSTQNENIWRLTFRRASPRELLGVNLGKLYSLVHRKTIYGSLKPSTGYVGVNPEEHACCLPTQSGNCKLYYSDMPGGELACLPAVK